MSGPPRWVDSGWWVMPNGTRRLLSWNTATRELKLHGNARWEDDVVLAVIDDEADMRARLDGWAAHNNDQDGLAWVNTQLGGLR